MKKTSNELNGSCCSAMKTVEINSSNSNAIDNTCLCEIDEDDKIRKLETDTNTEQETTNSAKETIQQIMLEGTDLFNSCSRQESRFECNLCLVTFRFKSTLEKHKRVVHSCAGPDKLKCKWCKYTCTSVEDIQQHETTHRKVVKPFKCDICGRKLLTEVGLATHKSKHTYESLFKCELCEKNFKSKYLLSEHVRIHYEGETVTCPVCGKMFKYKTSLSEHLIRHKTVKSYKCDICSCKFKTPRCLKSHKVRIHHDNTKKFECIPCGLKFKSHSGLTHHLAAHNLDVEFKCRYCSKIFLNIKSFRKHERIEKKKLAGTFYLQKCIICGKKFSRSSILERHVIEKHTDLQPYLCTLCGRTFKIAQTFHTHRAQHYPSQPYSCEICGKGFNQIAGRKAHQLRVHKSVVKSHHCDMCGEFFEGIKSIISHITHSHLRL